MSFINVNNQTFLNAKHLGKINDLLGTSLNRLSSGSVDLTNDPAAIVAVSRLDAQNKRAQAASTNVQNAASFVQTANNIMGDVGKILVRMSELAHYSDDRLKSPADISLYQLEFAKLQDQLRETIGGTTAEIGGTTSITNPAGSFNGIALFGPNPSGISVSSSSRAGDTITIPETNLRIGAVLDLFKQDASGNYTLSVTDTGAVQTISDAMSALSTQRAVLGGVTNRLDLAASSLATELQNISSVMSRIQDVDVATESTRLTKLNLLLQSGTAMLSQANESPKKVLQLLNA